MVIADRWPSASLIGLDSSEDMIDVARKTKRVADWVVSDIAACADRETRKFDLVFSNAALHWVPDHAVITSKSFESYFPRARMAKFSSPSIAAS